MPDQEQIVNRVEAPSELRPNFQDPIPQHADPVKEDATKPPATAKIETDDKIEILKEEIVETVSFAKKLVELLTNPNKYLIPVLVLILLIITGLIILTFRTPHP